MWSQRELFLLALALIFVILYSTKSTSTQTTSPVSATVIDINNLTSSVSDPVNNGTVDIYTVTVTFESDYLNEGNVNVSYAYLSIGNANIAINTIDEGSLVYDVNQGTFTFQFYYCQVNEGSTEFDVWVVIHNDDTTESSEYQTISLGPIGPP